MSKSLNNLDDQLTRKKAFTTDSSKREYLRSSSFASQLPYSVTTYYSRFRKPSVQIQKKVVEGTTFEIDTRYDIIGLIGQGAYGMVVAAKDKQAKKKEDANVAIKKIELAFRHKVYSIRTLRELKILRLLNHENVIGINTLLLPSSREEFQDIYVCSPLMETDLSTIIRSPQKLTEEHVQFLLYQILRGLKYVHSAGILHRDLKPRNLLVNSNCDLKICDFGLSRTIHCYNPESCRMTDYVTTRWYRAPELLLEVGEYGPGVDVWSVGCILAEMILREPFMPGTDTKTQLEMIFEIFGTPSEELIAHVPKPRQRKFLKSIPERKPKKFAKLFPKVNPLAVDLIERLLTFDWRKRITINEALKHPYLKDLHCPSDEPVRDLVCPKEFEFEKFPLSQQQLKDLVYEEILLYHFKDFKYEYLRKVEEGENPFLDVINNENGDKMEEVEKKEKEQNKIKKNDENNHAIANQ